MVVQHNIPALNSHRFLGVNNSAAAKNLEKLSSGYRINRAGDDAAGLAISEKMRGQIRGLAKAEDNTNNAINLIQTAEGGMQEMHSIVQRMRELAVQSTNGTYHNSVDREALDLEFQQLKGEFDRIVEYTNYNNIKLLNGTGFPGAGGAGAGRAGLSYLAPGAGDVILPADGATATDYNDNDTIRIELDYNAAGIVTGGSVYINNTLVGGATVNTNTSNQLEIDLGTDVLVLDGDWSSASELTDVGHAVVEFKIDDSADDGISGMTVTARKADSVDEFDLLTGASIDASTKVSGITFANGSFNATTGIETIADLEVVFSIDWEGNITATASDGSNAFKYSVSQTGTDEWTVEIISDGTGDDTVAQVGSSYTFKMNGLEATMDYDANGLGTVNVELKLDDNPNPTAGTIKGTDFDATASGKIKGSGDAIAIPGSKTGRALVPPGSVDPDTDRNRQTILFQVGANGTADQQVSLTLWDMSSKWLGLGADLSNCSNIEKGYILYAERDLDDNLDVNGRWFEVDYEDPDSYSDISVADLHILDKNAANLSIEVLSQALNDVSSKRAELGAVQNRLEYTLNNLGVTKENLTAAESTIRDVDMAKEMMDFTKNSILIQSAQAMLAQANTLPQGVLQLLR